MSINSCTDNCNSFLFWLVFHHSSTNMTMKNMLNCILFGIKKARFTYILVKPTESIIAHIVTITFACAKQTKGRRFQNIKRTMKKYCMMITQFQKPHCRSTKYERRCPSVFYTLCWNCIGNVKLCCVGLSSPPLVCGKPSYSVWQQQ